MTNLESFLPWVNVHVFGASEPLAIQALRSSCIDFCKRTDIVQQVTAAQNIVADQQDYTTAVPASMVLVRILGVAHRDRWLSGPPPGDIRTATALRGADIGTAQVLRGDPRYYFQKTSGATAVSLYPIPDTALTGGLLIKASFAPSVSATEVDDVLFNEWVDGIAMGAVYRLQMTPGQAFTSNPAPALAMYSKAVSEARRQVWQGKQENMSRVTPRNFPR